MILQGHTGFQAPYGGDDPNSENEGDRHSWDVWTQWQDYEKYTDDNGRFISEFGFQAMPCWKTVLSFSEEEDRKILSQVMLSHNKMEQGTERLVKFIVERIGFPKDFKSFVYLTQLNQAEAIKTGVEHWRARKFETSGTLYWQFNDCWPVASWSCIDYYKRKKALWYYTKKFFAPILPSLRFDRGKISLEIVNDFPDKKEANVAIKSYNFDGRKIFQEDFKLNLSGNSVTDGGSFEISDVIEESEKTIVTKNINAFIRPCQVDKDLLETVLFVEIEVDGNVYENYLVFDKFRNLKLQHAKVEFKSRGDSIELHADKPVFGLFIETEKDIDISDNCLIMEPGKVYRINFSSSPGEIEFFHLAEMVQEI